MRLRGLGIVLQSTGPQVPFPGRALAGSGTFWAAAQPQVGVHGRGSQLTFLSLYFSLPSHVSKKIKSFKNPIQSDFFFNCDFPFLPRTKTIVKSIWCYLESRGFLAGRKCLLEVCHCSSFGVLPYSWDSFVNFFYLKNISSYRCMAGLTALTFFQTVIVCISLSLA